MNNKDWIELTEFIIFYSTGIYCLINIIKTKIRIIKEYNMRCGL